MMAKPFTMPFPNVIPRLRSSSHPGRQPFRARPRQRSATDISRPSESTGASAGSAAQAIAAGAWSKPQCIDIKNPHRSASSCPDSAQSTDRSEDRMQRAQSDDKVRHAGLRPDRLIRETGREATGSLFVHQGGGRPRHHPRQVPRSSSWRLAGDQGGPGIANFVK